MSAIVFDATSNLVVACEEADVYIYSGDGQPITTLPCKGASSVAVDREGRIFVFEKRACRLSIWQ